MRENKTPDIATLIRATLGNPGYAPIRFSKNTLAAMECGAFSA